MSLKLLLQNIAECQICRDNPRGKPLPHDPRPVLSVSNSARLAIAGQAPGTRVHQSGKPFTDPSGDRLRDWMGVSEAEFYDTRRLAIIPMGFVFQGLMKRAAICHRVKNAQRLGVRRYSTCFPIWIWFC